MVLDWIPVRDRGGLPECLALSSLGQYMTLQLAGSGYKELVHRQLYQDLCQTELAEGVEIHHKDHNPQ